MFYEVRGPAVQLLQMTKVGVLALQGDFAEHETILRSLGAETRQVRLPKDLAGLDGLIIPGGESTTITRLLAAYELLQPVRDFAREHAVWGTCAGMIVMAKHATDLDREGLEIMNIDVIRNAFGRQVDSFETDLVVNEIPGETVRAVFIRAPLIKSVGEGVKVLAEIEGQGPVAAREGRLLVTSFHPELTDDTRMHRYFLQLVEGWSADDE